MCLFQQLALCDVVTATSHADAVGLLEKEGKNVLLLEGTNPFPRSLEGGRAWSLERVVEAAAAAAAGAGVAATDRVPGASVERGARSNFWTRSDTLDIVMESKESSPERKRSMSGSYSARRPITKNMT